MNTLLAPIILFVYNRPWHTEQTLEALMENKLADQSKLYIYCDGPKAVASEEDLKNIKEVRNLICKKNWCKEVVIIERDENIGLANSVIKGVTDVIERHGKVIVLEDDILTGKHFLEFMNDGLETYEKEDRVFGISGYKFPSIKKIKNPTYFLPIASSWTYATWSNRWNKVNFSSTELLEVIDNKDLKAKINFGCYPFYEMLADQILQKNDSWAIRFYTSMFLENSFFLFPNNSLVENIGFDDSGIHCGKDNFFSKVKRVNKKFKVDKLNIVLNQEIVNSVRKSFELNIINEISGKKLNFKNHRPIIRAKRLIKRLFRKLIE